MPLPFIIFFLFLILFLLWEDIQYYTRTKHWDNYNENTINNYLANIWSNETRNIKLGLNKGSMKAAENAVQKRKNNIIVNETLSLNV